jgi:hypothetical protein
MSRVHVRVVDRADYATDARRALFSSYTRVIDAQPSLLGAELPAASSEAFAQCPSCTFVDFLRSRDDLERFDGLATLRALFRSVPDLARAIAAGDGETIREIARALGTERVFEITDGGGAPRFGLPCLRVVRTDDDLVGALSSRDADDRVLVQPGREGPSRLIARLGAIASAGRARALVGFVEHAAAVEHYADFAEASGGEDPWPSTLLDAARRGLTQVGLALAFPPCASLQWGANRALEQLRARTDVHFRAAQGESSLMCPENVSGYSLVSDARPLAEKTAGRAIRYALRWQGLLFVTAG